MLMSAHAVYWAVIVACVLNVAARYDHSLLRLLLTRGDDEDAVESRTSYDEYYGKIGAWPFLKSTTCSKESTITQLEHPDKDRRYRIDSTALCGLNKLSGVTTGRHRASRGLRRTASRLTGSVKRRTDKDNDMTSRIVGGVESVPGKWPWLVGIGYTNTGLSCGGTIIASQWVVTAAHCIKKGEKLCMRNLRIGAFNWLYEQSGDVIDVSPDHIFRHAEFDKDTFVNDIALIKLSEPLTLDPNSNVNAICLPDGPRSVPVGTSVIAAGWGVTVDKTHNTSLTVREVEMSVITYNEPCLDVGDGSMRDGMVCAGDKNGGVDTCQGDSGGPLMYKKDGRWYLLGVTSFGDGCARPRKPGVYTDVGYQLSWISDVISQYS